MALRRDGPVAGRRTAVNSLLQAIGLLDARRRAVVAVATIAMFAAIVLLARGPGPGEMALLYAGLDPAAAGEVVAALEARGTPFEARGDAIWVPASGRDLARMALAAEGLPAASSQGYELLDRLSGFGTTSQMFDAAYWRAKEGELARTILAVPDIRAARVHIAAGSGRPFRREDRPTAAVTVTTRGATLAPGQARALRHLVAAAVPGLAPADVAVIDGQSGLVGAEDEAASADAQAGALRERALRLLEARVGAGNAVVEISVETVTETERLTERTLDPESRVAISTESQDSESTSAGAGGAVTVASNLPDGEAAAGAGGGPTSEGAESRSLTNYEVSETSREVLRAPGAVRRLTVAVLVNDAIALDAEGAATSTPRPEEELASLGALVGSAVGLDEARGDRITIRSMPFEIPPALGSEPAAAQGAPLDLMGLLRPALLALVAVVLGVFVVRPILRPGRAAVAALPSPDAFPEAFPEAFRAARPGAAPALTYAGGPEPERAVAAVEVVDPVTRLRRLIEARQDESAQVLQSWIEDAAERERA